ncbi:penicillin acylase family protein [Shewanella fidelis]|uniref:Penicillin acylase family protein n=1 Tax=Shewanella fidelis TaxID=173509 RepID=A0AAW8NML5_9GAMM|nr:penicillin acylase family protein [Shewanella fidelis]MDR8523039.1 penicillin acylase family protein [Shewanella fidelis]MDW4811635.1 penicillin acylase family protein [Shewanella fidelis]MDW4815756.1 penicillin acylase family protein [Shewanella fidelis]MDW4819846.1 penicillin acylase family protein [Shewanella fidelis]MDW4824180.1 penicillin acylase family protein [Shewanella fidelis]
MHRKIKIALLATSSLAAVAAIGTYWAFSSSLPKLSDSVNSPQVSAKVTLERDRLGTAIISADNRQDAAYGLGYAHGQDRFFQMDLLRRNAAGELAEIFGEKALELDKRRRFHQLRKRANTIAATLPPQHLALLNSYAQGVNDAVAAQKVASFEYLVTGATPKPWVVADSLLVIFSMYLDLQGNTIKRDLALTQVENLFGADMRQFLTQASHYQAALDSSVIPLSDADIPALEPSLLSQAVARDITEPVEVGSNNWAVTPALTANGKAMLSDDMHLSFAVPIIWYRAQLNYQQQQQSVQLTGVSLPGAPAIVVGSNGRVAWGFTNAYIDTADWIAIDAQTPIYIENETIALADSEVNYEIEISPYGPVKQLGEQKYALAWVAHQPYAVDMNLLELDAISTVEEGIELASTMGIPVQNMLLVDDSGNAAWKPAGAFPSRTNPSDVALVPIDFQPVNWQQANQQLPSVVNPEQGRLWSGNSRVVSTKDHQRLGDGGYALGARSVQIRDRLFEAESFAVDDFYQLQLDNQARFLQAWQTLLLSQLERQPQLYAKDIELIKDWQACACADSVGYTLVRYFRSQLIDNTFAPLETELSKTAISLGPIKRSLEPAMWQLIEQQPASWLASRHKTWADFMLTSYRESRDKLLANYSERGELTDLAWGKVNQLSIQHPFSKQIPMLSGLLDMPTVTGFGDSYMPAVQGRSFGASQRFIVQAGDEQNAIMTVPGGQSGHPLSEFYRAGFDEYATQQSTPLLPGEVIYQLQILPSVNSSAE